jgi:membrane fusion protein, heavy metal efflux system
MRTIATALAAGMLLLAACDRPHDADGGHDHHEAAAPPGAAAEGAGDAVLRVHPEMLRDLRITTSAVESRPGSEGVTVLGEAGVDEERYAEVGSPIPARVAELTAGVGDDVSAGQPLAVLESVELGRARAELSSARARAELARLALARKRGLAAERIVPRREVQEAEATAAEADAVLRAAEATVHALGGGDASSGQHATRFPLRSPVAGTVIERQLARGQTVEPGRTLFRVADLSTLWLTVHAFERDAVRVSPGTEARVTLAALPGRAYVGTITLVGRRVDPGSRTVPVRIALPNADGVLRPGMSASAWLPLGDAGTMVVAVPAAALQRLAGGWSVFVPRGEGAFEARPVGRGRDLGGEVEVVAGLAPGEIVVVDGAFLLKAEAEKARGQGEHHDH